MLFNTRGDLEFNYLLLTLPQLYSCPGGGCSYGSRIPCLPDGFRNRLREYVTHTRTYCLCRLPLAALNEYDMIWLAAGVVQFSDLLVGSKLV